MTDPTYFPIDGTWDDEKDGARRKYLARGEQGFHAQYSTFPAGYRVPPHIHDVDELLVVLEGGCTVTSDSGDGGASMAKHDSVTVPAGHEYGFTCGAEGMTLLTVRATKSTVTYT